MCVGEEMAMALAVIQSPGFCCCGDGGFNVPKGVLASGGCGSPTDASVGLTKPPKYAKENHFWRHYG